MLNNLLWCQVSEGALTLFMTTALPALPVFDSAAVDDWYCGWDTCGHSVGKS